MIVAYLESVADGQRFLVKVRPDEDAEARIHVKLVAEMGVGTVAAGAPILAAENIEETIPLPAEIVGNATFVLKIKGDSMVDAGILDGDHVVVRQQQTAQDGDIVVALLEDEATVKRFFKEPDRVRLQPENEAYEPMVFDGGVDILGVVVAVLRRLG